MGASVGMLGTARAQYHPRVAAAVAALTGCWSRRRAGRRPRLVRDLAAGLTAAGRARHLSGGVAERGADLVDLELDGSALLAFLRLVGALLEATGRDDAGALRQRARDVLGELAPDGRAEEQRFAVLPLARLRGRSCAASTRS